MGKISPAVGELPVVIEIDGKSEKIVFRAMAELDNEIILGMDFCRVFDIDTRLGWGLWRACEGLWHVLAKEPSTSVETEVFAECVGISIIEPSQREEVEALVETVLARKSSHEGVERFVEHHIKVNNEVPFKHKLRRVSPKMLKVAQREDEK